MLREFKEKFTVFEASSEEKNSIAKLAKKHSRRYKMMDKKSLHFSELEFEWAYQKSISGKKSPGPDYLDKNCFCFWALHGPESENPSRIFKL